MSSSTLPITTVVTITVETPEAGLNVPAVNNLCIISKESPISSVPAAGFFIYQNSTQVGTDWGTGSETYLQAVNVFAQRPNPLSGGGQLIVYAASGGQTLTAAIQAVEALIYAGGYVWAGFNPSNGEIQVAVSTVDSLDKLIGVSSYLTADLSGGGLFATISAADEPAGRMLLYTQGGTYQAARLAMAAYMGRGMSVDFTGSDTCSTMNLKDLIGVLPDSGITPSILNTCQSLGVDVYASIQGVPKVLSNGGPHAYFFDSVYDLVWFTNALQVAIFNALATTNTKIPQTEQGMAVLRAAATAVCQQAVGNGFLAPGQWTGPDAFGDPETFDRNISQNGYYILTQPVAKQSQQLRQTRVAPVMQIAAKEAGAIHSANILVFLQP